jgi:ferrous iron transport protein B
MASCCSEIEEQAIPVDTRRFAVIGNPNSGKTTLFNALTGLKQKVGNYPGVTVERKEGAVRVPSTGQLISLIDLPGLYSLTPRSPDEVIARDVLLGRQKGEEKVEGIINVVDASNLERNLYLTTQLLELGLPLVVILTMNDIAEREGRKVNQKSLETALGVPVISINVRKNLGVKYVPDMIATLPSALANPRELHYDLPSLVQRETAELRDLILVDQPDKSSSQAYAEAISLLMAGEIAPEEARRYSSSLLKHVVQDKEVFDATGLDYTSVIVESRYGWIESISAAVIEKTGDNAIPGHKPATPTADRVDRVLLHRFWGYVIFFGLMALIFQAVFSWAQFPMNLIGGAMDSLASLLHHHMPAGPFRELLIQGVIGGVGTSLQFLPQILILFFFLGLLEDSGYLARAAFLMDKLMSKVGLHGKSFIPMLSSFACAIPGIMATRTIDDRKSRLVTILVAPLMSCPARLPVYSLMIGAFIPLRFRGLTMFCMYMVGTVLAFTMAWLFKKTLLRSAPPRFFIELPPYHLPSGRAIMQHMVERSWLFLQRAGTIILMVSVVLWWLSSYPKHPSLPPAQQLTHSYAGVLGKAIEPAIKPLGFDWKIGISLVTAFVAREVFVSSMGTIYAVGDNDASLRSSLKADPDFSPLKGICVMLYYVLAMQCLSTAAVVRRETNSWKWPIFQLVYMTALAWIVTFAVWQCGSALHLGQRAAPAVSAIVSHSTAVIGQLR